MTSNQSEKNIGKFIKFLSFLGLIILFLSLFLPWYSFNATTQDGTEIAEWTYSFFLGWHSNFVDGIVSNEKYKPQKSPEVLIGVILTIAVILVSAYGMLFKHVEQTNSMKESKPYIYVNVFLLMLTGGYFLAYLPYSLLIRNEFYFPFLKLTIVDEGVNLWYCIGPSYIMQMCAFVLMFPNIIFLFQTYNRFEAEKRSSESIVERTIKESEEFIPLDKLIAEEEQDIKMSLETPLMYNNLKRKKIFPII